MSRKFRAKNIKEATEKIGEYIDKEGYELKTYVRNDDGSYDIEMILPSEKTEGEKTADLVETVEFQKKLIRVMGLSLQKLDPSRSVDEWITLATIVVTTAEASGMDVDGGTGDGILN